ncbi:MAG: hypothetical protein FJ148_01390 [Deltaproteobacteria bacterium]|nr:hypothetical protein [Deltaproteobacteria bacterium]
MPDSERPVLPPTRSEILAVTVLALAITLAACSDGGSGGSGPTASGVLYPTSGDPGVAEWQPVAPDRVVDECGLDPGLLAQVDARIGLPWAAVRYGKLCHEHYPGGAAQIDEPAENFSATKTLGAVVTGIAAWQTRDIARDGRKTGPIRAEDRADHWLDEFSFNPEARLEHVLAMIAHNEDLSYGKRSYDYDTIGTVQINRLNDVIETAIAQDAERLGGNLEEFTQRFLFGPLGMRTSRWSGGVPDKNFAFSWSSNLRDMARLGLLLLHGGTWSGERILGEDWVYAMTHPSFEDTNPAYGYLTWLNTLRNDDGTDRTFDCAPLAVNSEFPHGLSEAKDCGFADPANCAQEKDVGIWYATGLFGQYIIGHRALDLVLVVKDFDDVGSPGDLWDIFRPALVARDAEFAGNEAAFCEAYARGRYAPDLR